MNKYLYDLVVKIAKRLLGIPSADGLSINNFIKYKRLKYGPRIYKKKYNVTDVLHLMSEMGMREGSNVFVHSSWNEFYNYSGTEIELIEGILGVIGPSGTLIMPAYPFLRKNKLFDVGKTLTKAGLLAEEFRKYPGVKRSINIQHSVCALGPLSDFLLSEHHLGNNCWDEKSPYFKLSQIDALIFSFGLHKAFIGTIIHCVEGVLYKDLPYFRDMFTYDKVEHRYIDYDGKEKSYFAFDDSCKKVIGYFRRISYYNKYIRCEHRKISNLHIRMHKASVVLPILLQNGRKGIVMYSYPKTKGYKFMEY